MNYYLFHIGDYVVHTRHLSLLEDLAYRRLLDLYYTREAALPADVAQIARLIGMREQIDEVRCVLGEFFDEPATEGDGWHHKRCDAEIDKAIAGSERARTNGIKGGRPLGKSNKEPRITQPVISGLAEKTQAFDLANPEKSYCKAPITHYPLPITQEKETVAAKTPRPGRKAPAGVEVPDAQAWIDSNAPGVDWRAEHAKFADHTFKNPISDWSGAWRNWMRRAAENVQARASPTEGRYAREMREKYEQLAPSIAARRPVQTFQNPMEILDGLTRIAG